MKFILTVLVVSALLAGALATASAQNAIDLSTLGKKVSLEPITLPQLTATMPTIPPAALGGKVSSDVIDLSTLNQKKTASVAATFIQGSSPITVTPSFSIRNSNVTAEANTVFTLPQAISANAVYTPAIAIFGGS
ncbi:MAG: hypothetical protein HPY61_03215 [Methanotrichaceae archaeon]|nr:hypothetical protein [Methanotrichaceae archaeon]